jgi:hypothetical protein
VGKLNGRAAARCSVEVLADVEVTGGEPRPAREVLRHVSGFRRHTGLRFAPPVWPSVYRPHGLPPEVVFWKRIYKADLPLYPHRSRQPSLLGRERLCKRLSAIKENTGKRGAKGSVANSHRRRSDFEIVTSPFDREIQLSGAPLCSILGM